MKYALYHKIEKKYIDITTLPYVYLLDNISKRQCANTKLRIKQLLDWHKHHCSSKGFYREFHSCLKNNLFDIVPVSEDELYNANFSKPLGVEWRSTVASAKCNVCGAKMIVDGIKSLKIGTNMASKRICAYCLREYGKLAEENIQSIPKSEREQFEKTRKVNLVFESI